MANKILVNSQGKVIVNGAGKLLTITAQPTKTITWDGDTTGKEFILEALCHVSSEFIGVPTTANSHGTVMVNGVSHEYGQGKEYEMSIDEFADGIVYVISIGSCAYVEMFSQDYTIEEIQFHKGVYFSILREGTDVCYVSSLTIDD